MTKWILVFLISLSFSFAGNDKNHLSHDEIQKDYHEKYPDMSYDDLIKHIDNQDVFIIDVNSEDSYTKSHVTGAVNFYANQDDFAKILPKEKDALIVAYCGGKLCTAWWKAADKASELGYTNVFHFSEGIKGWNKRSQK